MKDHPVHSDVSSSSEEHSGAEVKEPDDQKSNPPRFKRYNPKVLWLKSSWRHILRCFTVSPKVLLRFLMGLWRFRGLEWHEYELLKKVTETMACSNPTAVSLLKLLNGTKYHARFGAWWQEANTSKNQEAIFFSFYFHRSIVRVPSERNFRGLDRKIGSSLKYFFCDTAPHDSRDQRSKRKNRRRGHNDHGSLPCNPAVTKANKEGGQAVFEDDLVNRPWLVKWLRIPFSLSKQVGAVFKDWC
jgi:hypothetical protein